MAMNVINDLPHYDEAIGVWPYPAGGDVSKTFYGIGKSRKYRFVHDMTISIDPSAPSR